MKPAVPFSGNEQEGQLRTVEGRKRARQSKANMSGSEGKPGKEPNGLGNYEIPSVTESHYHIFTTAPAAAAALQLEMKPSVSPSRPVGA